MKDFLRFRAMITPIIVQILFWLAFIASLVIGIDNFIHHRYQYAIEIIILGPVLARIAAELLLIIFGIYSTLQRIEKREQSG